MPASTDNPVFADFLSEVYMESYDDLKQFLRKIGVKIPLNDQNTTTALRTTVLRAAYDYVDIHKYWDHPVYVGVNRWNPPSLLRNQSVIFSEAESPARLMLSRLLDRPMMVTEFDFPAPNRFRAEGAVLTGAYAALQDWDGLFQFVYTHHPWQLEGETTGKGDFFASAQDPVKYLAQIIGIRLFLDRGVRPASGGFALILDAAGHAPFSNMPAGDLLRLGLIAKVGSLVVPPGATPPASYAGWLTLDGASPALSGGHPVFPIGGEDSLSLLDSLADAGLVSRKLFDVKQKRYRSATGQIELDGRKGTFRVVSPGCEAVILPEKLTGEESQFVKDYYGYYKTPRGFHKRSINSNGNWNTTSALSFINMPILNYSSEIRNAVLMIHGENAHSRYFSEDAYKKLKGDNKELLIIPGANHVDLYDQKDKIPFDKIENFFKTNMK